MKKLVMALAVVMVAVVSQGATIKWSTSSNLVGVDLTGLSGNGDYAAGGADMKSNSTLAFTLTLFDASNAVVGSYSGDLKYGTGSKRVGSSFVITEAKLNTDYNYTLVVTGTQNDLKALGVSDGWDYSAATVSATIDGTMTTVSSGATTFTQDISSWTVAGAVAVPEPTSGLLVLLGMAGLALKRKRA